MFVNIKISLTWIVTLQVVMSSFSVSVSGSEIKTSIVSSSKGKIEHPVHIILPDSYSPSNSYITAYVLHGYDGSYKNWVDKTAIEDLANELNIIIVTPDGSRDSWYLNTPSAAYANYIVVDIISHVDKYYSTIKQPSGRIITGLSMGGFGALYLGIENLDVFGAIGAMSAVVDPRRNYQRIESLGMSELIGPFLKQPQRWNELVIINRLHKIMNRKDKPTILFDVGVDDTYLEVNRRLHETMLDYKIEHEYIEREGGHSWSYWDNSIKYQLPTLVGALRSKRNVVKPK